MMDIVAGRDIPPVLERALNAILNGLYYRMKLE